MNHWIVKQEPESYSWADFLQEGSTSWTGVRNFQARNNLRQMKRGDRVFFYHSGDEKQIVGVAKVSRGSYPDPTAEDGDWVGVDLAPVRTLAKPVSLAEIKKDPALKEIHLVRNSRLSVSPLTEAQFERLLAMAEKS